MKKIFILGFILLGFFYNVDANYRDHQCGIDVNSDIHCWGQGAWGTIPSGHTWKQVSGGDYRTCGIDNNGDAFCWGGVENFGQNTIPSGHTWKQISAGMYHTCGIDSNNDLYCWGDSRVNRTCGSGGYESCVTNGVLFPGYNPAFYNCTSNPTQCGKISKRLGKWKQVSAGWNESCGIDSNDNLSCWGSTTGTIPSGHTWKQVAINNGGGACGIDSNDALYCWGSTTGTIPSGHTWKKISLGGSFCGLNTDNQILCWGGLPESQIVPSGHIWKDVVGGLTHNCGIDSNNNLYCWGRNSYTYNTTQPDINDPSCEMPGDPMGWGCPDVTTTTTINYGTLNIPNGYKWSSLNEVPLNLNYSNVNGNYTHYIFNRLTATEGNMQYVNNSAGSTSFSNSSQVKSNFLANYSYMQSWYESKGLTMDVINNNVDWNNGVTFSKTDVAGGMLDGYKLSAHYPFMSYKETDNTDSSIFWRTDLSNTSFQTDTTWTNVGIPAYPIRNGSGGIVAYLQFPCGNLICKDQYCSDIKKIINVNPPNPIEATVFADPGNGLPYCGDAIKNTMDEECDTNDGIRHDLGETCSSQCKVETSPGVTPGCPSYAGLGYSCNGASPTPIFTSAPVNQSPVPTYSGFGTDKNVVKNDTLTATDNENDTLTFAKFSDPAHGTVTILGNGSFTYSPSLNYIGADSFFYSVSDGVNGAVTQEVTIVVNDVVVGNNPPVPTFSSLSVNQGAVYNGNLTATDTENDTLTYISTITTSHGVLNINNDGSFTYTPDNGYSGNDTFTYAVSDGHNLPVERVVTVTVNGIGGNSGGTGSVINWTPPNGVILPVIGDINTNTGMTDTEKTISNDVVCSSIDEGFKNSKSIIVTNTMADTSFLTGLKGKTEFIKTLSGSSTEVAEKIIQKKLKAEKLNIKSSTYDLGTKGTVSGIQFNLSKIPNSAVMRKLVNLAIDHSSTTMADYEQTVKDSCNGTITSTGTMVVPAGFIDVNEKGETMLNLFRYNGN